MFPQASACFLQAVTQQQATLPVALHNYCRPQAKNSRIITGNAVRVEPLAATDMAPSAASCLHSQACAALEPQLLAACPGSAVLPMLGQAQQRPANLDTILLQQQMQRLGSRQQAGLGQSAQGQCEQPKLPHNAVPQVPGQDAGWQHTAQLQLAAEHQGHSAPLRITELSGNQPAGAGAASSCLCAAGFSKEASPEEEEAGAKEASPEEEEAEAEDDLAAPASSGAVREQAAAAPCADAAATEGVAAPGGAPGGEASAAVEDATAPDSSRAHWEAAAAREAAAADGSPTGAAGAGAAPGSSRQHAAASARCCSFTQVTAAAADMVGASAEAAVEEEEGRGPSHRRRRRRQVQDELAPGATLEANLGLAGGRTKRVPGGDPLAVSFATFAGGLQHQQPASSTLLAGMALTGCTRSSSNASSGVCGGGSLPATP